MRTPDVQALDDFFRPPNVQHVEGQIRTPDVQPLKGRMHTSAEGFRWRAAGGRRLADSTKT